MWALFTRALIRSPSTTRVSIVNTSANFVLTAMLGFLIFAEALPPLWWLGASLLVVGNVIIGRRDREAVGDEDAGRGTAPAAAGDVESLGSEEDGKERDGEGLVFFGDGDGGEGLGGLEDDTKGRSGRGGGEDPARGPSLWDRDS